VGNSSNKKSNLPSAGSRPQEAGRLDEQLCFALYAASNALTRIYRPLLNDLGLTYPQYLVMLVLWEHKTRTIGEIATELELATHAVSPIIDRLETAELVKRVKDTVDTRVVHVELTKAGAKLEPAGAAVQEEVRCRTMLKPGEVTQLRGALQKLIDLTRED
jgi:DNA-binding MarR family transcriptional regulator